MSTGRKTPDSVKEKIRNSLIGHTVSKETREKIRKKLTGRTTGKKGTKRPEFSDDKHPGWKGINAGYSAIHKWVTHKFGKPIMCEECGVENKKYHWSNISGEYKRDISDWRMLCVSCHKKIDLSQKKYFIISCKVCKETISTNNKKRMYCSHRCLQINSNEKRKL